MSDNIALQNALSKRNNTKAIELLLGIVTGVVADQQLHDLEIKFLREWLALHQDVATTWPGSVVAKAIEDTLDDGIVTEPERAHLISILQQLVVTDFSATGSAASEVLQLPINDNVHVDVRDRHVCHTGEFLYGTRARCEQLTNLAGGFAVSAITKKVAYLVVGTNVSPDWAHTSYGRKIEQAIALQSEGHGIRIVSEKKWLDALSRL
jgi:NAD-dependent DNA ligase